MHQNLSLMNKATHHLIKHVNKKYVLLVSSFFSISICKFKGPFKCYVTQMGEGVSDFLEKSVTKV